MNHRNKQIHALANHPPDSHDNVNDSCLKLTAWVGLCGNGDL